MERADRRHHRFRHPRLARRRLRDAACGLVVGDRSSLPPLERRGDSAASTSSSTKAPSTSRPWSTRLRSRARAASRSTGKPGLRLSRLTTRSAIERRSPRFGACLRSRGSRSHRGTPAVTEERWPWAEIEPRLDVEAGVEDVVERLRASVARMPAGPIIASSVAGLDSRLVPRPPRRASSRRRIDPHRGSRLRPRPGDTDRGPIAETVGVPHQVVPARPADYWSDLVLRSLRVDYQVAPRALADAEARDAARSGRIVVDGFGFDVLAVPGRPVLLRGDRRSARRRLAWSKASGALCDRGGTPHDGILRGGLGSLVWSSAHRQFMDESERFRGHPARAVLTFYRTREVRGIACAPYASGWGRRFR